MAKITRIFEHRAAEPEPRTAQEAPPTTEYFTLPDDYYYHCPECDDGTWYVGASGLYICGSCGLQIWGSDLFAS